jgi:hypothetical protein
MQLRCQLSLHPIQQLGLRVKPEVSGNRPVIGRNTNVRFIPFKSSRASPYHRSEAAPPVITLNCSVASCALPYTSQLE